ncbi:hypothetical protein NDU88_002463 [Pleurodeles waltl]|uniref:Uncharacterized protein n=1 Tax=Pleurodeles waltl TaxID=8319 RepID=A0AAV7LG09_PLEWA|nr:hypothetical protein NDU88_002463 [Pleurodeles waltl]
MARERLGTPDESPRCIGGAGAACPVERRSRAAAGCGRDPCLCWGRPANTTPGPGGARSLIPLKFLPVFLIPERCGLLIDGSRTNYVDVFKKKKNISVLITDAVAQFQASILLKLCI